jgi:tetratricopeptide (TPR) repeat protein
VPQGCPRRVARSAGTPPLLPLFAAWAAVVVWSAPLGAAPWTPSDPGEVLEELPGGASGLVRELTGERRSLAQSEPDLARASALAWRILEVGRLVGDPRAAGIAEGVLAPWIALAEPPDEVLLLRATLRQRRHEFDAAERDLALLLRRDPHDAQAWLTRAVIQTVRGDLADARRSCAALIGRGDALAAVTCFANAAGDAVQSERSAQALASALAEASDGPAPLRAWSHTSLAELYERLGRRAQAEAHHRAALALSRDPYALAAYADFLLDCAGRASEVVALLREETRSDGLLLRLALAEHRLGDASRDAHVRELEARFAVGALRGERLHLGEEARLALAFDDPERALPLAAANFASQREPRDVRVLLEAALAANDPAAAKPALDFLAHSSLHDVRLAALASRLRSRL